MLYENLARQLAKIVARCLLEWRYDEDVPPRVWDQNNRPWLR